MVLVAVVTAGADYAIPDPFVPSAIESDIVQRDISRIWTRDTERRINIPGGAGYVWIRVRLIAGCKGRCSTTDVSSTDRKRAI